MEAYSDGVEAARKRVQSAWEGFALIVNESGVLETAFNALATAIENLHWIIISATIALAASNPIDTLTTVSGALSKLGMVLSGSALRDGTMISALSKQGIQNTRSALGGVSEQGKRMADAAFIAQKQSYFSDYLGNFKGGLTDEQYGGIAQFQDFLIGLQGNKKETIVDSIKTMLTTFSSVDVQSSYDTLLSSLDDASTISILGVTSDETADSLQKMAKGALSNVVMQQKLGLQGEDLNDSMKMEAAARRLAAANLLQDIHDNTDDAGNYTGSNLTPEQARLLQSATENGAAAQKITRGKTMLAGALGTVALIGGSLGGQSVGGSLAKAIGGEDFEGLGQSIGTILGGTIGKQASSAIFKMLGKGALSAARITGWGAIAAVVVGGVWTIAKKIQEKAIKEAQEKFQELKTTYDNQLSSSTKTTRYDELVKGVDQFGRNVSLTEEEYSEFLSISNELAKVFPDLVVRTDDAGNSFLGAAGKVTQLTEAVNEMVKSSQKAADLQLLGDKVFGTAFDDAKEEYNKEQSAKKELKDEKDNLLSQEVKKSSYLLENRKDLANQMDAKIEKSKKRIEELESEVKELEGAQDALTDYNNAIMREDVGLQLLFKQMSDDSAVMAKQTMQQVFSSLDLSKYANEDEYRDDIEKISNKIAEAYKDNPILATLEVEMSSSVTSGEYYELRQQVLENLLATFGEDGIDADEEKILIKLGFELDKDGNWYDTTDIRKKIEDEFENKLSKDVNLDNFSVEDLERIYKILNGSTYGTTFNNQQLQQSIFADKYSDASLSKIAQLYQDYADMDDLTAVQQENFEAIKNKLELWADELGVVNKEIGLANGLYSDTSDYYDEIIRKAKMYGDLTSAGTSYVSGEDVLDERDEYLKYYNFLEDEYSKTGKFDAELLDSMMKDTNLQEFLAKGDISGMKDYITEFIENTPNRLKNYYQQVLGGNENVTKQLTEDHKEVFEDYEEDYNLDLTKFTTLNAAKEFVDAYTNSIITSNWETWVSEMDKYYQQDLAKFTTTAMKKQMMAGMIMQQQLGMTKAQSSTFRISAIREWQIKGGEEGTGVSAEDYVLQKAFESLQDQAAESMNGNLEAWKQGLLGGIKDIYNLFPDITIDDKDKRTEDINKYIERLEALTSMYNKEYYLRKSLKELDNKSAESQDAYMDQAYYDKMHQAYSDVAEYYNKKVPWTKELKDWSEEEIGYYQKYQEAMVNLNNLDDEQIEDKINILQLENMSYEALISAQEALIETSDSYEELLDRQKEYNNLLKEQLDYQKEIAEWQVEIIDYGLEYEKNSPTSKTYAVLMDAKEQALNAQLKLVKDRIEALKNPTDDKMKSYAQSMDGQKELHDRYIEQNKIMQELASLPIEILNDKLDEIDRSIDLLKKAEGWGWYEQLDDYEEYYDLSVDKLESKAKYIQEQLNDVSELTDEEIQTLLDQMAEVFDDQISLQQEYNQRLKEQTDLVKQNADWQKQILENALEYTSYSPNSKLYTSLMKDKEASLNTSIKAVKDRINALLNPTEEMESYVASQEGMQELQDRYQEYNELVKELASLPLEILNDKLDAINRSVELLEKSKPEEWSKYGDIDTYYQKNLKYLKDEAELIKESLEDVSSLTDEEIQDLIDKLNDATAGIKEAEINLLEEQKTYKESQYDAVVDVINEYKQNLQDAINEIEKEYEDELKPLQDINEELERQANLEDLIAAKKKANKEKSRVYREGVGWVYESDRTAQRKAEEDLENFYRQDKLDDLEATKEAEIEILNDRIEQWDVYLQALNWRYQEAERNRRDALLAELLDITEFDSLADLQKQIYDKIYADMIQYNIEVDGAYKEGTTMFDDYLTEYTELVDRLRLIREDQIDLVDPTEYIAKNDAQAQAYNKELETFENYLDDYEELVKKLKKIREEQLSILDGSIYYGKNTVTKIGDDEEETTTTKTGKRVKVKDDGNAPEGLSVGDIVETAGGYAFQIVEAGTKGASYNPESGYWSIKIESTNESINTYSDEIKQLNSLVEEEVNTLNQRTTARQEYNERTAELVNQNKNIADQHVTNDNNFILQQDTLKNIEQGVQNNRVINWNGYIEQSSANYTESDKLLRDFCIADALNITSFDSNADLQSQVCDKINEMLKLYNTNSEASYAQADSLFKAFLEKFKLNIADLEEAALQYKAAMASISEYNGTVSDGSGSYGAQDTREGVNERTKAAYEESKETGKPVTTSDGITVDANKDGRANGILGGPVTETGPMMLHGSPSAPEYVLNSDQAYTLLKNISTTTSTPYANGGSYLSSYTGSSSATHKSGKELTEEEVNLIENAAAVEAYMKKEKELQEKREDNYDEHISDMEDLFEDEEKEGETQVSKQTEILKKVEFLKNLEQSIHDGRIVDWSDYIDLSKINYSQSDANFRNYLIADALNISDFDSNADMETQICDKINEMLKLYNSDSEEAYEKADTLFKAFLEKYQTNVSNFATMVARYQSIMGEAQNVSTNTTTATTGRTKYTMEADEELKTAYAESAKTGQVVTTASGYKVDASTGTVTSPLTDEWTLADGSAANLNFKSTGVRTYAIKPADMSRDQKWAGQTVIKNGYAVTYDDLGYAVSSHSVRAGSLHEDEANSYIYVDADGNQMYKAGVTDNAKTGTAFIYGIDTSSSSSSSSSGSSSSSSSSSGSSSAGDNGNGGKSFVETGARPDTGYYGQSHGWTGDKSTDDKIAAAKDAWQAAKDAGDTAGMEKAHAEAEKLRGHADGILGGPVTYTGLSMLHGTPTAPEYVLNSDQAYTMLRNLSTLKMPEYTSTIRNDSSTQYIVQGDVVLENCEDPAEFWNAVAKQMRNRYNVTKNKKNLG